MLKQLLGLCNSNSSDFWCQRLLYPGCWECKALSSTSGSSRCSRQRILMLWLKDRMFGGEIMPSASLMSFRDHSKPSSVMTEAQTNKGRMVCSWHIPLFPPSSLSVRQMSGEKRRDSSWPGSSSGPECWRAAGKRDCGLLPCSCSQSVSRIHLLAEMECTVAPGWVSVA